MHFVAPHLHWRSIPTREILWRKCFVVYLGIFFPMETDTQHHHQQQNEPGLIREADIWHTSRTFKTTYPTREGIRSRPMAENTKLFKQYA